MKNRKQSKIKISDLKIEKEDVISLFALTILLKSYLDNECKICKNCKKILKKDNSKKGEGYHNR